MLVQVTKYDIQFQLKQGFYLVYGILSLLYIFILFNVPLHVRTEVTAYLILSDTTVLGLTFVGALVLLEKQQNVLQSLFITPLKLSTYLAGKVLSLALISVIASSLIGFVPGGMLSNWIWALVAIVLSSMFFTLFGLGVAARVNSLNQYIVGIIVGGMVMGLPVALYFIWPDLSVIFPINATIDLLITDPSVQTVKGIIADVSVLVCWNIVGFLFAYRQFNHYVLER
ncbi:MAG TPA: ABC transporter permease [Prolixibacteraceae bacterium]|nr:ABC transporter permease [Prolixibacteraceae bacterium]